MTRIHGTHIHKKPKVEKPKAPTVGKRLRDLTRMLNRVRSCGPSLSLCACVSVSTG